MTEENNLFKKKESGETTYNHKQIIKGKKKKATMQILARYELN